MHFTLCGSGSKKIAHAYALWLGAVLQKASPDSGHPGIWGVCVCVYRKSVTISATSHNTATHTHKHTESAPKMTLIQKTQAQRHSFRGSHKTRNANTHYII